MQTQNLDEIFMGAPSTKLRKPLSVLLKDRKFSRYVIPFAGRFAIAATIAGLGVKPEQIQCSDISLFSSALGYYLSGHRLVTQLNVQFHEDPHLLELPMNDELSRVTSILYALKYVQLPPKNYYITSVRNEYVKHWEHYWTHIRAQVEEFSKLLYGISYKISDALVHVSEVKDDETAFVYLNPPIYKNKYSRMFQSGGKITWDAPAVHDFTAENYSSLFQEYKATVVVMAHDYRASHNITLVPNNWEKVFANQTGNKITYYVSNKPLPSYVTRSRPADEPIEYLIHTDADPLTKNSKIQVAAVSDTTAKYYRDLFIHRLGVTDAECHLGLFVDGKLMTVFGLTLADALFIGPRKITPETIKDFGYIFENYGITGPSKQNKNRLFMSFLISSDFKAWLESYFRMGIGEFKGIKTVCLTRLPENRILHGLYKCTHRDQLPDKTWKLVYQSPFNEKTFRQTIVEWLDSKKSRQSLQTSYLQES